jgi:hypothetical protein
VTSSQLKAKLIRVTIERGREGLFYAESPDMKGLFVAKATLDELREEIPVVIGRMYEACDVDVDVREVEDENDNSWVAVPVRKSDPALIAAH